MKLILTSEVPGLGSPGEVVEVKDGYGRNYLVPRGYAMSWTKGGEKQVATIRRAREAREVRDLDHAKEIAGALSGLTVRLPAKSGQGDRLFGSVTTGDIVDAVTAAGGPQLDKRLVHVAQPIKTLGAHTVSVKVHPELETSLTVTVVKD